MSDPIVIVSAARTPMGGFQGDFASLDLRPARQRPRSSAAVERAGLDPALVEEVDHGLRAARRPGPGAGAPGVAGRRACRSAAGCTTVNKMCGSGMKAAMFAHDLLVAGSNDVMVAGGMESMSNAPYVLPKARAGYRIGHGSRCWTTCSYDGLEDAYDKGA
jgi:acetyl-CoA C-acetyltransferase